MGGAAAVGDRCPADPRANAAGEPALDPTLDRGQDEGIRQAGRLRPAPLEPCRRHDLARDPGARHGAALLHVAVGRPGLERHRPRSRPARRGARRALPADRQEGAAGRAELRVSRDQRQPRRAAGRDGGVRDVGAVGLRSGRRDRRPRPRRRDRVRPARRARRRPQPQAGELQPRHVAERGEPGADQGVPAQHRAGRDPDVHRQRRQRLPDRRRPAGRPRHRRRADGDGRHRAAAPLLRAAAGAGLRAAAVRSARRRVRDVLGRLRGADVRAADQAVHRAASAAQAGSVGAGQRRRPADRLLPRSRHAGADPLGAARRRGLVGAGVRSRRLPQRLPRRADAGGRRSARCPLQRDPVAAHRHARLELRRQHPGPAHRRDHQGPRLARIPARAPGLPARRGPAVAVSHRRRDAAGAGADGARAAAPALGARGRPHARLRPQLLRQHAPAASR